MATLWTDLAGPSRNGLLASTHRNDAAGPGRCRIGRTVARRAVRCPTRSCDAGRPIHPYRQCRTRCEISGLGRQIGGRGTTSRPRVTVRVAHGRDTSPAVSADAQQSTHCNSLGETRIFECAAGNYATALRAASYKMPNWMECEVRIIGPIDEIARFRTAHIGNDQNGELQLDFDSIIAMHRGGPLEMPSQQGDRIATGKSCARSNKFMVRQA